MDGERSELEGPQAFADLLEPQPPCKHTGHEISPDRPLAYYPDGVIVGYCGTCGCRMQLDWFPGGTSAARAKLVAASILAATSPPSPHLIQQLREILERLRKDRAEIQEASDMAQLALKRVLS